VAFGVYGCALIDGGEAGERHRHAEGMGIIHRPAGGNMVSARDAYDDWYEDDEPYGDPETSRYEDGPRRLSLVRRPSVSFEVVVPEDFAAAQLVADRLRDGVPVLIDLHGCDRALAGRLTDFSSGLVYALGGTLQIVGRDVVLLAPSHLDLSGDEASGIRSPGFYNRS
jgi:cell division inhibitor SepF